MYARNCVYKDVRGWDAFEPWLSRIEKLDPLIVREIAGEIPPEWVGHDWQELEKLAEEIISRRGKVRDLITAFRNSSRQPFPDWAEAEQEQRLAVQ